MAEELSGDGKKGPKRAKRPGALPAIPVPVSPRGTARGPRPPGGTQRGRGQREAKLGPAELFGAGGGGGVWETVGFVSSQIVFQKHLQAKETEPGVLDSGI